MDIAFAYNQLYMVDECISSLTEALTYDEDNIEILVQLGKIYLKELDDYESAFTYLHHAMLVRPDSCEVLELISDCYEQLGNGNVAKWYGRKAQQLLRKANF